MGNHRFIGERNGILIDRLAYAHFAARSMRQLRKKTIFLYLNIIADIRMGDSALTDKMKDFKRMVDGDLDLFKYNLRYAKNTELIFAPIYPDENAAPKIKYHGRKPITLPMLEYECQRLTDKLKKQFDEKKEILKTASDPRLIQEIMPDCKQIGVRIAMLLEAKNFLNKFVD